MALSEQELDLARRVKEQGGTQADFLEILEQKRKQQKETPQVETITEEVVKTPDITVGEQVITPTQDPSVLTPEKISQIWERRQLEEKAKEQEKEEGLKWFISESWEALTERWENIKGILSRRQEEINKTRQEEWTLWVVKEIFRLTPPWMIIWATEWFKEDKDIPELQLAGQVVAGTWDIIWEWLENLIQDATPEKAEEFVEELVSKVSKSKTVQDMVSSWQEFEQNNPEKARNIKWLVNISEIIPITKWKKIVEKPFSEVAQKTIRDTAEQSLKDTGRAILNLPWKTTPKETLNLTKFFADKVKPTESFDDIVSQFDNIWSSSIKQLDNSLKNVTKTFKPTGAKEVLNVIRENLEKGIKNKSMPFSQKQLTDVKQLLKKFNAEWLTLTELNKIKRSISDYTKTWTSAWKDAAWVAPEAMRGKYREVMKFIENAADKQWVSNVAELNQNWIKSNTLTELLGKQATSIGKKKGTQALQKRWVLTTFWTKIRQLREDLGLSDAPWAVGLEDISLSKALETIKKISKKTETKTIQETLKNKLLK